MFAFLQCFNSHFNQALSTIWLKDSNFVVMLHFQLTLTTSFLHPIVNICLLWSGSVKLSIHLSILISSCGPPVKKFGHRGLITTTRYLEEQIQVSTEVIVASLSSPCQQDRMNICYFVRIVRQTEVFTDHVLPTVCTFKWKRWSKVQNVLKGEQDNIRVQWSTIRISSCKMSLHWTIPPFGFVFTGIFREFSEYFCSPDLATGLLLNINASKKPLKLQCESWENKNREKQNVAHSAFRCVQIFGVK